MCLSVADTAPTSRSGLGHRRSPFAHGEGGRVGGCSRHSCEAEVVDGRQGAPARPWIIFKIKVAVIQMLKANESKGKKRVQSSEEKKRKPGRIHGAGNFTGTEHDS